MANKLNDEARSVVQRSGTNTGSMRTEAERASFAGNVKKDIAAIMYQLNNVYYQLIQSLSGIEGIDALDLGLCGNVIFSNINATAADSDVYWSSDLSRAKTIKESLDTFVSEVSRLENEIDQLSDGTSYDDTALLSSIQDNTLNLTQLMLDTMGTNYTLDGDGNANLTHSLSRAIDAIGAFFTGFPGTGNTYTGPYPPLSLAVNLSDVVIDTTIPKSTVLNLNSNLATIQTFTGMDGTGDSTPDYSAHNAISIVSDGDSLELGIAKLDATLTSHASRHITGGADEIDGDRIDIDWAPTNYTQDTTPAQVLTTNELTSHLKGIDNRLSVFGTDVIRAQDFKRVASATGPSLDVYEMTGYVVELLNFDTTAFETGYATIPIPTTAAGARPTRVKATLFLQLGPNGGPYVSGTGVEFRVAFSSGVGNVATITDATVANPGWDNWLVGTKTGLSAANLDHVIVLDYAIQTLASNTLGLLNIKVDRNVLSASDNWGSDCGLVAANITWYA